MKVWITTSSDTISELSYSSAKTYVPATIIACNSAQVNYNDIRYGRAEEKIKIYSQATRRQDEILGINEKLKNLAKHI